MMVNYRDIVRNVMAREKALYEGHAVAAVAAISNAIAKKALRLIEVDYEPLPHVIDAVAAMQPGAPILHEDMITDGVDPAPTKPSNVAKRVEFALGDVKAGFAAADVVVEREFNTQPVHQAYIEPHACVGSVAEDGQAELWVTTQGHFVVRAHCARLLGMDISKIRVTASEIGGGFGGKTVVYLEPVALGLSRKAGRPVKMVMTRDEVFRASGPTSGAHMKIKIGATKDGKITAGEAELIYQAGAFPGSPVQPGAMCAFAPYDLENVKAVGWDVVTNRSKVAAYRAPGAPISEYAVECVIDELAKRLGIDPIDLRLANAAKEGTRAAYGPKFGPIGLVESLEQAKAHPHYQAPLGPNQGRGVASGFWFNIGGETCASLFVNEDGTTALTVGHPRYRRFARFAVHDGGRGARHRHGPGAADHRRHRVSRLHFPDRRQPGDFLQRHGGDRCGARRGPAALRAGRQDLGNPADAVEWEDGYARPAGANAGNFEPMSLADIAAMAGKTGGPVVGHAQINAQGAGPSFGTHLVDVEVDRETGRVTVLRYTVLQDAGKAVHPSYVEGQFQGRRGAGHRLGTQRGIHLRCGRQARERGLPRLPHSGRLRRADDRYRNRRSAQSAPSLWRARDRRDPDHSADGCDRQCHRKCARHPLLRAADVAAEGLEGDRRDGGGGRIGNCPQVGARRKRKDAHP